MPSVEVAVEAVDAVVSVEMVEEVAGTEIIGIRTRTKTQALPLQGRDTRVPDIRICQLAMCPVSAPCIISGGRELSSALSPPPAPGRMFTPQDLKNETGTSPVTPVQT